MALYNVGRHAEATERLLRALAETSMDDSTRGCKRAILFYAQYLSNRA